MSLIRQCMSKNLSIKCFIKKNLEVRLWGQGLHQPDEEIQIGEHCGKMTPTTNCTKRSQQQG